MKNIVFMLLSIFALTACQQEEVEIQESKSLSRSAYYGLSADWTKVSFGLGEEMINIEYANSESGSMEAAYILHTRGTMAMEVTLHNSNDYTMTCDADDFYLTSNSGTYPHYHKAVSIRSQNSYALNYLLNTVTLQANESKTVYIYTDELFREGYDYYSYNTEPYFMIALHYKDSEITCNDVDAVYDTRSYWERYR